MTAKDPIVSFELFLFTADGYEQLTSYPVNKDGSLGKPQEGEWSGEADAETEGACVTVVHASGAQQEYNLSGSDHRDLEDGGSYETLFTQLIEGADFPSAHAAALAPPPRKAPRRP